MNAEIVSRLEGSFLVEERLLIEEPELYIAQARKAFEVSFREGLRRAADTMAEAVAKDPSIALAMKAKPKTRGKK